MHERLSRRAVNAFFTLWIAAVFIFLFAPIVTAVIYSFNVGVLGRQTTHITGLTTHWYGAAWSNQAVRTALFTSIRVATGTALIATILGTVAAFGLARRRAPIQRSWLELMIYLILLVPEIVLAFALLSIFIRAHIQLGFSTLIAAHSIFTTAVVAIVVLARVVTIDPALEEAAADLGAGHVRRMVGIVLPQIAPAMIAGGMLAFAFSFDDVVISNFLSTPTVTTLPVYLFSALKTGITPTTYAVASSMLAFTLVLLALIGIGTRWQLRRAGDSTSVASVLAGGTRGGQ
jgi:ABC-type spermidine/putrescine transport system permease subunit II